MANVARIGLRERQHGGREGAAKGLGSISRQHRSTADEVKTLSSS